MGLVAECGVELVVELGEGAGRPTATINGSCACVCVCEHVVFGMIILKAY